MTWGGAVALSVVQGLTEFLPVSSSGHLVLAPALVGWRAAPLLFDVMVHVGTLVSVGIYFGPEIRALAGGLWRLVVALRLGPRAWLRSLEADAEAREVLLILLATFATGLIGLAAAKSLERTFSQPRVAAGCLLLTAAILLATDVRLRRRPSSPTERSPRGHAWPATPPKGDWARALVVGVAQAIAILPGLSRSGMTICSGLWVGFDRDRAVRFAFLLSIPAVIGAAAFEIREAHGRVVGTAPWGQSLVGAGIAAVVGLLALHLVFKAVRRGRLWPFAAYCAFLGVLALGLLAG